MLWVGKLAIAHPFLLQNVICRQYFINMVATIAASDIYSYLRVINPNKQNIIMKKLLVAVCALLLLASCGDKFSVKGTLATDILDGEYAYVKCDVDGGVVTIDSCRVLHSAFELAGTVDSIQLASLYIGNTPIMPFVLEKGDISIDIVPNSISIGGTPLNEELGKLMNEKATLEARMVEIGRLEASMILNGHTPEAAAAFVSDSIAALGVSMESMMNVYIRRNYDNVLAPCIFALLYSAVSVPILSPELERLYEDAPESFRRDAFVNSYYSAAQENMSRMQRAAEEE